MDISMIGQISGAVLDCDLMERNTRSDESSKGQILIDSTIIRYLMVSVVGTKSPEFVPWHNPSN